MKVKVFSTDGRELIGYGDLTDRVPVFVTIGDGPQVVYSETVPALADLPPDGKVLKLPPTPKIVMEDGSVRFGAGCWWEQVEG